MSGHYTFNHNEQEYEVRIVSEGDKTCVRVFKDGKPANGFSYSVAVVTQVAAQMSGSPSSPVKHLIKIAESDVIAGVWEKYIAATKEVG